MKKNDLYPPLCAQNLSASLIFQSTHKTLQDWRRVFHICQLNGRIVYYTCDCQRPKQDLA